MSCTRSRTASFTAFSTARVSALTEAASFEEASCCPLFCFGAAAGCAFGAGGLAAGVGVVAGRAGAVAGCCGAAAGVLVLDGVAVAG